MKNAPKLEIKEFADKIVEIVFDQQDPATALSALTTVISFVIVHFFPKEKHQEVMKETFETIKKMTEHPN